MKKYPNVIGIQGDIRYLSIPDFSFDVISIVHVIHDIHPGHRVSTVQTLVKKMERTGRLFIYELTRPSHGMSVEEIRTDMDNAGLAEVRAIYKKSSYIGQYERKIL